MAKSYCDLADAHPAHRYHHDVEHGRMPADDAGLLERLAWEINQAGLSWLTILKKRDSLHVAYAGFDPTRVAAFDAGDIERLLADPGVIRHRGKIEALIHNAEVFVGLAATHGSAKAWFDAQAGRDLPSWVRLFRKTFRFTGPEIVREFLEGVGYLPGAHATWCPLHAQIIGDEAPWRQLPDQE